MKRHPKLLALSREHHAALVLALRIAQADASGSAALMGSLPERFRAELAPHFAEEESTLLPRLAAAGAEDLVARTLAEHRRMEALVAAIAGGDTEALQAFGKLLQAHVRFEERELFVAAENRLPGVFGDADSSGS